MVTDDWSACRSWNLTILQPRCKDWIGHDSPPVLNVSRSSDEQESAWPVSLHRLASRFEEKDQELDSGGVEQQLDQEMEANMGTGR